jgi:hypothetical protein
VNTHSPIIEKELKDGTIIYIKNVNYLPQNKRDKKARMKFEERLEES